MDLLRWGQRLRPIAHPQDTRLGWQSLEVTNIPGTLSIEASDGALYFLETAPRPSALWRLPAGGGAPTRELDGVVNSAFDVVERGIYFIDRVGGETGGLWVDLKPATLGCGTRLASRTIVTVIEDLGTLSLGLTASRDGRTLPARVSNCR